MEISDNFIGGFPEKPEEMTGLDGELTAEICEFIKNEQYDLAIQLLEKTSVKQPDNLEIQGALAGVYFRKGEFEKSLEIYRKIIRIKPEDKEFKTRLAENLIFLKKFDEAYELEPENEKVIVLIIGQIFKWVGECHKCGQCCRDLDLFQDGEKITSEEQFEEISRKDPRLRRFLPVKNEQGKLVFDCQFLGPGNLCLDHLNRLPLCKNYPGNYVIYPRKSGCGFNKMVDLDFQPITNLKLLANIINYAITVLGMYDAAGEILKKHQLYKVPA